MTQFKVITDKELKMLLYTVTDIETKQKLTNDEILFEINRDRSEGWQDYTLEDLFESNVLDNALSWIDADYYEIELI